MDDEGDRVSMDESSLNWIAFRYGQLHRILLRLMKHAVKYWCMPFRYVLLFLLIRSTYPIMSLVILDGWWRRSSQHVRIVIEWNRFQVWTAASHTTSINETRCKILMYAISLCPTVSSHSQYLSHHVIANTWWMMKVSESACTNRHWMESHSGMGICIAYYCNEWNLI